MKRKGIILGLIILLLIVMSLVVGVLIGKRSSTNPEKKENKTTKTTINTEKLSDKEYSIPLNETLNIEDISIELVDVKDSRCPAYAECYWPGEIEYGLLINGESYELSTVNKTTLDYQKYVLKIIGNKCDEHTLVLKIERK